MDRFTVCGSSSAIIVRELERNIENAINAAMCAAIRIPIQFIIFLIVSLFIIPPSDVIKVSWELELFYVSEKLIKASLRICVYILIVFVYKAISEQEYL